MKRNRIQALLIFALTLIIVAQSSGRPFVNFATTNISSKVTPYGSLQGGTSVYIYGSNFNTDPSLVSVYFGPYPCNLIAGSSSSETLACMTTKATSPNHLYNQALTIYNQGQKLVCTSSNCVFTYATWKTPTVHQLIPKTIKSGDLLYSFGIHRLSDPGDARSNGQGQIRDLLINDHTCHRIDVLQRDSLNVDYRDYIACNPFTGQQAGEYNFTERVDVGYANSSVRSYQTSYLTGEKYQVRHAAEVSSSFPHQGGYNGAKLALTFTGHSKNIDSYTCKIAGQDCSVSSIKDNVVNVQVPKYNNANTLFGAMTQDVADVTTKQNSYIGSNGFKYWRYTLDQSKTLQQWIDYFRAGTIGITLLQGPSIHSEIGSPEVYGTDAYIEYLQGYLYIPIAGTYSFWALADDKLIVNIAKYQGNSNSLNMQTMIKIENYYNDHYNPYVRGIDNQYTRTFTQPGYYYVQVVSTNGGGAGYFKVMMEVPNNDATFVPANPSWQIDYISIKQSDMKHQIINVTVVNTALKTDSFKLSYYVGSGTDYVLQESASIKANFTADQFRNAINYIYLFNDKDLSVTLKMFDKNKLLVITPADAISYEYIITIKKWRNTLQAAQQLPNTDSVYLGSSVFISLVQKHSAPIAGTFKLTIDNTPLISQGTNPDFSYNSNYYIQRALNSYYKTDQIQVSRIMTANALDSIEFVIYYYGATQVKQIKFDTTNLTGGPNNLFNTNYTVLKPYSTNYYYDPIPFQFMRVAEDKPQLHLTVNEIPVICSNCDFQFKSDLTASILTATLSGYTISFTLSNPNSITFTLNDIEVTFLNYPCVVNTGGSITAFSCTFPVDENGNNLMPSGKGVPVVHIKSIGYALTTGVAEIVVSIIVTTFVPAVAGPEGDVLGKISGSGYPVDGKGAIVVSLCGNTVTTYTSITNNEINFIVPAQGTLCSASSSSLRINGEVLPLTFSYDSTIAPLVSGLSISQASPIMKQDITITGSNFESASNLQVFLYNTTGAISYELTVVTATSTSIQCILGGGKTGDYFVRVLNKGSAGKALSPSSPASSFKYKIFVESVTPNIGSMGGGYDITITGRNFAGKDSTNVFVGDAMNSLCKIKTITSTTIVCTVPSMDSTYVIGTPVEVVVTGRAVEQSVCDGSCDFTFDGSSTNNVSLLLTTTFSNGETITVTGSDLTGGQVYVGDTKVTAISSTSTSITFNYPPLTSGSYDIKIKTGNSFAYPPIPSTVSLWITSGISRSSGSFAGHIISVTGSGMTTSINDGNVFQMVCPIGGRFDLKRVNASANRQAFQIPKNPSPTDEQTCKVNITQGTVFKTFGYTYSLAQTNNSIATLTTNGDNFYLAKAVSNTRFETAWVEVLDANGNPTDSIYPLTITTVNASTYLLTSTTGYLPAGNLRVKANSFVSGNSVLTGQNVTRNMPTTPTGSAISISYLGGYKQTITGSGFIDIKPSNNFVSVCGLRANIVSATSSSIIFSVPPLITQQTQALYALGKPETPIKGTPIGDTSNNINLAVDSNTNTFYTSTSTGTCYIGVDFGVDSKANITSIAYMGNPSWAITAQMINGAVFEGSNDNAAWTEIFKVDSTVHTGWNTWINTDLALVVYRYVRFRHDATSLCQLAELTFTGQIYSTVAVNAAGVTACDVKLVLPGQAVSITGATISYSADKTSTISQVSPKFGPSIGGTTLTITGKNFGTVVTVTIDDIPCAVSASSATSITCLTGKRASPPANGNSFSIVSDGNPVILACEPYLYIDRWSSQDTWGGQALPREGDSVYVPKGMTLLVDASTPKLFSVIVDGGSIFFSDQKDMTFDASYFLLNGGQFRAGTPQSPYQHKLTFTLYGGYYDKQLPTVGNKMIACRNCKFNMHGIPRVPTWTDLDATISPGQTTVKLTQAVDWNVGETIAVAASGFNHYESQDRVIASKSADNKTLTVTKPFSFRHFSGIQTYGGKDFYMRAEVSLLTRNIKMQGDPTSQESRHGSHLMLTGKVKNGLDASLSYAQFTNCGQPKIVGRYCTHFHMAGQVPKSFVRGISVHHSLARVLTIHGTHYLLVEKNVGYRVQGHNIFVEDGIETKNIIQDNLMISSINSFTMLQSDITTASYWITNPFNTVVRNRAAGGDFYGFWYEIKEHPDGPSATSDICPEGMQLGLSRDNIAHSYLRFGLRIFRLSARQFPCVTTKDESLADPYSANKAIQSVFSNYTLWKNKQCGFLGQQLGFTTVQNFKTIDSVKGGMQFHKTNYTKEQVVAIDSVIVGYSSGNGPIDLDLQYENARGLIASRTDGLLVKDIQFVNFGPKMTPLQSCSECWTFKLWVTGGKTTHFKNITYTNIQGNYIYWQKWRRQIFIDMDGSLTAPIATTITPSIGVQTSGSITPYRPSLMIPNHCHHITGSLWDDSIYCDQTITLRGILFTNAIPVLEFSAVDIRVRLLGNAYDDFASQTLTDDDFSKESMIVIKPKSKDIPKSWAMPFATGQYYNVHWKWGLDYTHVAIFPSRLWTDQDGVVLRFNYTDQRELYMIGKWYKQQIQLPYIVKADQLIQPSTCLNGDYFHDIDKSYLFVCISGRNKTIQEWVDVNGIRCLNACPKDLIGQDRQDFTRLWSNVTNWPNNQLPKEGENVTIPSAWNLILDCDTPIFNYVQVRGYLIFDQTRNALFQAHYIWVKGKIKIGTKDTPYVYNANIVLHGQKNSTYMVIDADASGNKMMVVTGGLQFFGSVTDNIWNRLTVTASAFSSSITVEDSSGWKVGDEIIVGATYANQEQGEKVTIKQINGKVVSFAPPLAYEHYGDASITVSNSVGQMDTRAGVGLLSRNIKISRGPDADGWGCRVLVYSYLQIPQTITAGVPKVRNGYAILDGVQFQNCGQYDTGYAGLRIQKLGNRSDTTVTTSITRSSLHDCVGICLLVDTSHNVTFDNNVFYWARKFLALIYQVDNYNFTNNFLAEARKRSQLNLEGTLTVDDIACYEQYVPIDYANGKVSVTSNLAQGCMGEGFVFPFAPCEYLSTYNFYGNTAGSCEVAFMLGQLQGQECIGSAGLFGYASLIGLMANPPGSHTRLIYSNMIFTDNERGITLRFAHQIDDNALTLKDSYFAGYSRPNCPSCYSFTKLKYCKNGYAVRMFSATISGEQFPLKKKNTGFDVICTQESFDFKSFFDNVVFENYKYINSDIPYCSSMSVFKRHDLASDGVASAYLTNTKCLNCDKQSWAYFDQPSTSWRGWFGGCGELDCTGPNNYIIHDQDGSFTGSKSQLLANNSMIGEHEAECTHIPEINGYHCLFEKLAVMEYESIAPDFKSRIMWPVYLKYDGGSWETVTNGWREWQWMGPQPMNKRLARFWSVVKLHEHYNLTYSSSPPSDSRFQIQKRLLPSGNPTDWVIVRIYYPLPNSLEVLVTDSTRNNAVVKPFPLKQNVWEDLSSHTNECGANNFYYTNGTIEFVLNGINNCQVRVRLSSYIQISARLNVAVADFFTNNGPTTFLTNICAFLGIDTGRLKIVSVRSGSASIVAFVQSAPSDTQTPTQQAVTLSNMANTLSTGINTAAVSFGFPVIDHSVSSVIYNPDGTLYSPEQDQPEKNNLTMIIAIVIPISVIVIGAVVWFCVRRMRSKIYTHEMLGIQSSQIDITEKKEQPSVNFADKSHEKYQMEVVQLQ